MGWDEIVNDSSGEAVAAVWLWLQDAGRSPLTAFSGGTAGLPFLHWEATLGF